MSYVVPMSERTFTFRTDDDFLEEIDAWARKQPIQPSRGAAVRYLLRRGLDAEKEEERKAS